ncbi:hypothetical protein IAG44_02910 [Streptomyces roseirectus]|uniref:Uncharacterized protein n=1 Tax=Streptomyces roseirectus TaxID=2768066 RepID=A0A7H0I6W1_9ACTN|nr:hypothetical protein [Streptomyces roseirectus]QNP68527.1 hypothetical protein IAG44_02910 [Streptomyces roseirectus]
MFAREKPTAERDARLDPYRRAAARMLLDGREAGLLVTRVVTWWEIAGPPWRRRAENVREVAEWMVWRIGSTGIPPEDGLVGHEDVDEELADWSAGVFRLYDDVYALEWLPPEEAEAAHREHGWDAGEG